MGYLINGVEVEADEEGFLLEPDYSEDAVRAIAQAEGIELTDDHWTVVAYLRERFQEDGHTPNFRNMVKDFDESHPSGRNGRTATAPCRLCATAGTLLSDFHEL